MSDLETLLRASTMKHGRIALNRHDDGNWYCAITHFNSHMTKDCRFYSDPVDALRAALIEDERVGAEQIRKYRAASKAGGWKPKGEFPVIEVGQQIDLEEAIAAAAKGPVEPVNDADGMCMICDGGGCDLCRPGDSDDPMEMFG